MTGATRPTSSSRPWGFPLVVTGRRCWLVIRVVTAATVAVTFAVVVTGFAVVWTLWWVTMAAVVVSLVVTVPLAALSSVLPLGPVEPDSIRQGVTVSSSAVMGTVVVGRWLRVRWRDRHRMVAEIVAAWDAFRGEWARAAVWPAPVARRPSLVPAPPRHTTAPSFPLPIRRHPAPLVGWRAWKLGWEPGVDTLGTPLLTSVTMTTPWPERILDARCERSDDHPVPSPGCTCGVYAVKSVDLVPDYARVGVWAVGTVSLSGRVLEATRGYRAARAVVRGALLLRLACAGTWTATCGSPPRWVAVEAGRLVAWCDQHRRRWATMSRRRGARRPPALGLHVPVDDAIPILVSRLELRYGILVRAQLASANDRR